MATYTLKITFDQAGLAALSQVGQKVTIVKQTTVGKPIAWISFTPQLSNTITWTEQYSVYCSTSNLQAGATIQTSSTANAVGGSQYVVNSSGYFDPGIPNTTDPNTYEISNHDPALTVNGVEMITAGLLQGASVNGAPVTAPMCAVGILYNQDGLFTPIETIQVFTSSYSNNGMVISSVAGSALQVTYTTNSTANIQYNDQNNKFVFS
jgi:hypothetical protein